jgi:hypothetical protein
MHRITVILLFIFFSLNAQAQFEDTSVFKYPIQMDSVVVKATRGGWDLAGFIRRVRTDTTFFKSFKTLRVKSFTAINDIRVYDGKGKVTASLASKTRTNAANGCRTMDVLEEKTTGNFYERDGDYRYYTADLYAYLFFTKGRICNQNDIVGNTLQERGSGKLEKSKYQLKQLIFNPGSKIDGIPFMGEKAAIFEPEQAKKYDFKLASEEYEGIECYVFRAIPKADYADDVVYNELSTWFRKSDYSIVARDYSLSYKTLAYDFDVRMQVRTKLLGDRLVPTFISYDGNWHVFGKKRERVKFTTSLAY